MRIAIIGAGIAGLSCADRLSMAGHVVRLFDKGRGPGGRMATRRMDGPDGPVAFDHGAQYFTARDPAFVAQVDDWHRQGVIAPWPAAGNDAWVGTPGMNAVVKEIAGRHAVLWNHRIDGISRTDRGWNVTPAHAAAEPFDTVIIATPAEQAAPLLAPHAPGMADAARRSVSSPCWTAMLAFDAPLAIRTDVIRHAGAIGWAARNSAKPGRSGPETWVVQATPEWSKRHLEHDAPFVADLLHQALADLAEGPPPPPTIRVGHRWRYARVDAQGHGPLWDGAARIGAVGDWLIAPRVESAWLSGRQLADRILAA